MVAQVPDRRTGRLAGAVGIALLLAGLTLLLEPASRRAGGGGAAGRRAGRRRGRRPAPARLGPPPDPHGAPQRRRLPGRGGRHLPGRGPPGPPLDRRPPRPRRRHPDRPRPPPPPDPPQPPTPRPSPRPPAPRSRPGRAGPHAPGATPFPTRSRPRARRNPTARCRAPRRGTVAHRRNGLHASCPHPRTAPGPVRSAPGSPPGCRGGSCAGSPRRRARSRSSAPTGGASPRDRRSGRWR